MPNGNNSYTLDFEFRSKGGEKLNDMIKNINKEEEKRNAILKERQNHLIKEYERTAEGRSKQAKALQKEKEALSGIEKNLKSLAEQRKNAEKLGDREWLNKIKNSETYFKIQQRNNRFYQINRQKELKDIEIKNAKRALTDAYNQNETSLRRSNNIRDDFRQRGLKAGLSNFGFSKSINRMYDDAISKNDSLIENLNRSILEKDKELTEDISDDKRKELENEKKQLENRKRIAESENKSLSVKQFGFNTAMNAVKKLGKTATTVFRTMGIDLKSIMSDALNNIKAALDPNTGIASYNVGSSLFTNAKARESQMKYGLSSGSNYAFMQAKDMLNISSDEDIMYMNEKQRETFNGLMDKYRTWYENLESTGALERLQETQLEFKMFKQEIAMKFLNWFANHKEAIFKILEVIMNVVEGIANAVEWILDLIPGSNKSSFSSIGNSDTYNSNTNSNVNINVNNTNNATANLNNQMELETTLNNNNTNLVKLIATEITSR